MTVEEPAPLLPPTSDATYERARRLANRALWSVELQCRRLRSSEPEDAHFLFRLWADFDYLIVSLTRLRQAAVLASKTPEAGAVMATAIANFDAALPDRKRMRDVAEHIEDYGIDEGRNPSVKRTALEVSYLTDDGPTLKWLDAELNAEQALRSGQELFKAMQDAAVLFAAYGPVHRQEAGPAA